MKKFFLWAAVVVLVLTGILLVIMYNMGDRLIEEAIKSDLMAESIYPTPLPAVDATPEATPEATVEATPDATLSPDSIKTTPSASNDAGTVDSGTVKATEKPDVKPTKEPEKVTMDKINEIKDDVSASDKITAAAMVMKRLTTKDINELKAMLTSGLGAGELKKAKEIAYKRFSEKEIEQIKDMYEKYMEQEE